MKPFVRPPRAGAGAGAEAAAPAAAAPAPTTSDTSTAAKEGQASQPIPTDDLLLRRYYEKQVALGQQYCPPSLLQIMEREEGLPTFEGRLAVWLESPMKSGDMPHFSAIEGEDTTPQAPAKEWVQHGKIVIIPDNRHLNLPLIAYAIVFPVGDSEKYRIFPVTVESTLAGEFILQIDMGECVCRSDDWFNLLREVWAQVWRTMDEGAKAQFTRLFLPNDGSSPIPDLLLFQQSPQGHNPIYQLTDLSLFQQLFLEEVYRRQQAAYVKEFLCPEDLKEVMSPGTNMEERYSALAEWAHKDSPPEWRQQGRVFVLPGNSSPDMPLAWVIILYNPPGEEIQLCVYPVTVQDASEGEFVLSMMFDDKYMEGKDWRALLEQIRVPSFHQGHYEVYHTVERLITFPALSDQTRFLEALRLLTLPTDSYLLSRYSEALTQFLSPMNVMRCFLDLTLRAEFQDLPPQVDFDITARKLQVILNTIASRRDLTEPQQRVISNAQQSFDPQSLPALMKYYIGQLRSQWDNPEAREAPNCLRQMDIFCRLTDEQFYWTLIYYVRSELIASPPEVPVWVNTPEAKKGYEIRLFCEHVMVLQREVESRLADISDANKPLFEAFSGRLVAIYGHLGTLPPLQVPGIRSTPPPFLFPSPRAMAEAAAPAASLTSGSGGSAVLCSTAVEAPCFPPEITEAFSRHCPPDLTDLLRRRSTLGEAEIRQYIRQAWRRPFGEAAPWWKQWFGFLGGTIQGRVFSVPRFAPDPSHPEVVGYLVSVEACAASNPQISETIYWVYRQPLEEGYRLYVGSPPHSLAYTFSAHKPVDLSVFVQQMPTPPGSRFSYPFGNSTEITTYPSPISTPEQLLNALNHLRDARYLMRLKELLSTPALEGLVITLVDNLREMGGKLVTTLQWMIRGIELFCEAEKGEELLAYLPLLDEIRGRLACLQAQIYTKLYGALNSRAYLSEPSFLAGLSVSRWIEMGKHLFSQDKWEVGLGKLIEPHIDIIAIKLFTLPVPEAGDPARIAAVLQLRKTLESLSTCLRAVMKVVNDSLAAKRAAAAAASAPASASASASGMVVYVAPAAKLADELPPPLEGLRTRARQKRRSRERTLRALSAAKVSAATIPASTVETTRLALTVVGAVRQMPCSISEAKVFWLQSCSFYRDLFSVAGAPGFPLAIRGKQAIRGKHRLRQLHDDLVGDALAASSTTSRVLFSPRREVRGEESKGREILIFWLGLRALQDPLHQPPSITQLPTPHSPL